MIYLVTVHDKLKQFSMLNQKKHLKTKFWDSFLKLTKYKTVLLPVDAFKLLNETPLPNRRNILFSSPNKLTRSIPNIIVNGNVKEIIATFQGSKDDLFILCSNRAILEYFAKDGDFIVDYTTDELEGTEASMFDLINFADYTFLTSHQSEKLIIRYFVREKTNYLGN